MANEKLARRYATAVYSLAREAGADDRVGDELAAAAHTIAGDPLLANFFASPVIARTEKERVLAQGFGSLHEIALHALLLLVRKRRETILQSLVAQYRTLQLAQQGREAVTVTAARALPTDELHALVERLEQLYRTKFAVTQVVDPNLIGGVRILFGDRRLDGSVAGRLDALSRTLFARN